MSISEDDVLCDLPDQVDERAIQMLVDEIIHDKETNIFLLPDKIEAGLYRNTVRMTLNAIYNVLKGTDGQPFLLGHKFNLRHYPASLGKTEAFQQVAHSNHVNMKILEEVADRLLQNKNINQPLIPDVLERQIYVNCLKVVMRVLDILRGSLRITFCGHSIGLTLENGDMHIPPDQSLRRASSIISKVSREDLLKYQQDSGLMEEHKGWFSFWGKQKRAMMNQVHATMFGLVIQIVQDMLDSSTIELVGVGKIVMDLIPATGDGTNQTAFGPPFRFPPFRRPQEKKKTFGTFVSGMGVGALLVVLLLKNVESPDGTIQLGQISGNLQQLCANLVARLQSIVQSLPRRQSKVDGDESDLDELPMTKKQPYLLNPFRRRDLQSEEALPESISDSSSASNTD